MIGDAPDTPPRGSPDECEGQTLVSSASQLYQREGPAVAKNSAPAKAMSDTTIPRVRDLQREECWRHGFTRRGSEAANMSSQEANKTRSWVTQRLLTRPAFEE